MRGSLLALSLPSRRRPNNNTFTSANGLELQTPGLDLRVEVLR